MSVRAVTAVSQSTARGRSIELAGLLGACLVLLAACGGGGGGSSGSTPAPPASSVPGAPSLVAVVAADTAAVVSFSAPAITGGSAITSYAATCTAGSVSRSATANSSPITVSGLQNNSEYSCAVTASNAIGAGASSASLTVTPASARSVSVTPILGGFTAGVTVELFRADNGTRIASGTTADDGKVTITYSSAYAGIQIIKLTGSASAKYYDERTDTLQPFGPDKVLLVVLPASVAGLPQSAVSATVLTHAVAVNAGVDASPSAGITTTTPITTSNIKASTDKVLSTFGLDPTKVDPLAVPAYLSPKDQGTGAKLQGTEAALTYGAALIAITKLTPPASDVASFTQTLAVSIKSDTVSQSVPQISTLPAVYQDVVKTTVAPASQQIITTQPAPGSSPWDTGVWDAALWF